MAISVGARLGAYEITALVGEGGMGRVFRARDTTLQRDVALKVLPESWWRDPDRLARLEREARLLAVDRLSIERNGTIRDLRPAISRPRWEDTRLDERRHTGPVAARR